MPDEPVNLTLQILREIRDEARRTNERLDETNGRLDALAQCVDETNGRLDILRTDLGQRIVESELRTATALTELAGTVREMTGVLRAQGDLRPRVERCERDILELRGRLAP